MLPEVDVSDDRCKPAASEEHLDKVSSRAYYEANAEQAHKVHVVLHPLPAGLTTDDGLLDRQARNKEQLRCLLDAVAVDGGISVREGVWYEPPTTLSTGAVTPIALAFGTLMTFAQMRELSRHAYVAGIEPAFGDATLTGEVPRPFRDCPTAGSEDGASKIEGPFTDERSPAEVVLNQELGGLENCGSESCTALESAAWRSTISARRVESCARSWIDTSLDDAFEAAAFAATARFDAPEMPPFQTVPGALLSLGVMLTRQEANRVARHPYVTAVRAAPNVGQPGMVLCPPDYDSPIPERECPAVAEQVGNSKYSQAHAETWRSSPGPHEVVVGIDSPKACPRPECPERECAELDQWLAYREEQGRVAQVCIRSYIESIGGSTSEQASLDGGSITCMLTWAQIEQVAAHPDVVSITSNFTPTPPP